MDNLNGATVAGRTISVEHVLDYKDKRSAKLQEQEDNVMTIDKAEMHRGTSRVDYRDDTSGMMRDGDAEILFDGNVKSNPTTSHGTTPWMDGGSVFEMLTQARMSKVRDDGNGNIKAKEKMRKDNDHSLDSLEKRERKKQRKAEKEALKKEKKLLKKEKKRMKNEIDKGGS